MEGRKEAFRCELSLEEQRRGEWRRMSLDVPAKGLTVPES